LRVEITSILVVLGIVFDENVPESSQRTIVHNALLIEDPISQIDPVLSVRSQSLQIPGTLLHCLRHERDKNVQCFPTKYLGIVVMLVVVFLGLEEGDVDLDDLFERESEGDDELAGEDVRDVLHDLVLRDQEVPPELNQRFLVVEFAEH
jgi:hypothetical protein